MDAEKFYEDYWTSGRHTATEWNEQQFQKWLRPLIGREAVLDYGCGMGYSYQRHLVGATKHYTGADVGATALATTQKRGLPALKIDPNDGTINVPADSFDGAVCSEVFEHLFDPLSAARELNRVLKPGGVLVVTVPNFGYHTWRLLAFLRARVPLEPDDPKKDRYKGVHIRFFGQLTLKRLLQDAGFVDIKIGSFDYASVWDVFQAMGPFSVITTWSRQYFPKFLHLQFLQDVWPNVFAMRLRAVARKPE